MKVKNISIQLEGRDAVSGIINVPETVAGAGIIFAHGANNDMNTPMFVHLAQGLAENGCVCLRFNFPYRDALRKSPDSQQVLQKTWIGAYQYLKDHSEHQPQRILAAGKSMGGRVASQIVAGGMIKVDGLIFLGYPLHAAGKKEQLRDSHLYDIETRMLFFAGTRDPLCDLTKLAGVLKSLKISWDLEIIEGGDHSFNLPQSMGISQDDIYSGMLKKIIAWL